MLEVLGSLTKLSRSVHMFFSQVPCKSSRLNTKLLAPTSADAMPLLTGSGYALVGTLLFGEAKPPKCAQIAAPSGPARNLIIASLCGVSLSMTATSPAPWMAALFALFADGAGKSKKLYEGVLLGSVVQVAPPDPVVPGL